MYTLHFIILFLVNYFTCTLANVPLKCFLQKYPIPNLFTEISLPTYSYFHDAYKKNSLQFDPVRIDVMQLNYKGLQLDTKNLEYTGLDDAILDEFSLNLKTKVTRISFHYDMIGKGNYKIAGTLFSRPISGEGDILLKFTNVKIDMTMPFNVITTDNGSRVVDLKEFIYWHDISDDAVFSLSNLYNGDKEKSDVMHYLINQNWRSFTHQFGKPYMEKIFTHAYNVIRNQFLSIPLRNFDNC